MSTRQLRLTSAGEIKKNLDRLAGKKINIVLNDNTVVFCHVLKIDPEGLTIQNGRLKKLTIPFSQISEIYFDTIA
jgi:ribosome maturation factor RimP